jgi:hypothetical protein
LQHPLDTFLFTADSTGVIDVAAGSIPEELATNTNFVHDCKSRNIIFNTNGDFSIYHEDGNAKFVMGTPYPLDAFFCMYTTN